MKNASVIFFIFIVPFSSGAEMDQPSQEALKQTVEVLKDSQKREQAFRDNPKYKEGESAADMLVRGNEAQKQQLYEMSAEVLKALVEKTQGDPVKMQEIVSQAQKNPSQFMEQYLSEAQKTQVRDLATQIEKERQPKSTAPSK